MNKNEDKMKDLSTEEDILFKSLDDMKIPKPSESFSESFANKLNQLSVNHSNSLNERTLSIYLKVASIAAIFLLGWFIGSINNRNDKVMLRDLQNQLDKNNSLLVLSLLEKSSVSDRLQATNVSYSMLNIDNQVIVALVSSLQKDPDPNVRIKCAEILALHIKPDSLCRIFEKALDYQNDPFMQLLLINYISSINDPQSKSIIINFTKSDKADEFVRSEVNKTLNL